MVCIQLHNSLKKNGWTQNINSRLIWHFSCPCQFFANNYDNLSIFQFHVATNAVKVNHIAFHLEVKPPKKYTHHSHQHNLGKFTGKYQPHTNIFGLLGTYLRGIRMKSLCCSCVALALFFSSVVSSPAFERGLTNLMFSFSAWNSVPANSAVDKNSWNDDSSVTDCKFSLPQS